MKKKYVLFISFLIMVASVIGYSKISHVKATTFDDQNLIFNFDDTQSDNDDLKSKVITITNETDLI